MINRIVDREEAVYNRYADTQESSSVVSRVGLSSYLNDQGRLIEELIKVIRGPGGLEEHLQPITVPHPCRSIKEVDSTGESPLVSTIRFHNQLIEEAILSINDLRDHTQI